MALDWSCCSTSRPRAGSTAGRDSPVVQTACSHGSGGLVAAAAWLLMVGRRVAWKMQL